MDGVVAFLVVDVEFVIDDPSRLAGKFAVRLVVFKSSANHQLMSGILQGPEEQCKVDIIVNVADSKTMTKTLVVVVVYSSDWKGCQTRRVARTRDFGRCHCYKNSTHQV